MSIFVVYSDQQELLGKRLSAAGREEEEEGSAFRTLLRME